MSGVVPSISYLKKKRKLIWIDSEIVDELNSVNQNELLSGIECPVRIIHGEEDEVVSPEESRRAVEKLVDGDLQPIPDTGHDYDETWNKVTDLTADWFKKHCPP